MHACSHPYAQAPAGRQRHAPSHCLERHCHDTAFATVLLSGSYLEAGDEGRYTVQAGDVLVHRAFESHLDCFSARGADVLIIPMPATARFPVYGRVSDPDALLRVAERSPAEAWPAFAEAFVADTSGHDDWPDLLARNLREQPDISLAQWAEDMGLRVESVSRGFRKAYGSSPKAYRAQVRARAAWEAIRGSSLALGRLATELGFSDQAHMSRAVSGLTGHMPRAWRMAAVA
ncbi:helix-turn-helix domain-containing protein [Pinirhizobacter soli]|uniref:helix-turn-helix domain-containing protein n=1 Tax=Pinirhizobacter soli TaxID=2786953 RepID=UPI00202A8990|nr:AraC family transcriptional regulator [Pinirhizobacter soli]